MDDFENPKVKYLRRSREINNRDLTPVVIPAYRVQEMIDALEKNNGDYIVIRTLKDFLFLAKNKSDE